MATTLFATQLARHPGMQRIPLETLYSRHPAQVDRGGRRYVPAVHRNQDGTSSIFLSPFNRSDRMLPDGRTIEYHPNRAANSQLLELVGREVTLYAQVARQEGRRGLVTVTHPPDLPEGVFYLRVCPRVPPSAPVRQPAEPAAEPPAPPAQAAAAAEPKLMWADME